MDRKTGPGDDSPDRAGTQHEGSMSLLVGRTREQDSLRAELAIALSGQGRVCLIGGEAGIGKTTLVRDLARVAAEHGARTLIGSCYDLSSAPPYGPWLDLYEACERDPALPAPPAALAGGHLAPVTDQAALFADVRRFMAALTQDGPALVILEDLHWADPASLDLLRHVGPHVRHWPVLLLITYRADELLPGRPLTQHLPALIREADATRFDLRRLDTVALRALIASRHTLPREDEDRLVAHLDRHAEGNPYFATEILRTLEADALLRREDGGWSLGALDQAIVPPLLRQVIEERVIHLGGEIRAALAIAAVIGHEVPLALWAEVADLSAEALLDTVERAVWAHLLEAERDGTRVRFAHALTREALYESILPPRRRAWHLEVAESLLATSQPDPETVALHLQAAGDTRAVEWLIAAGERAQRAYAWLTAAERFRVAADLLKRVEDAATARARRWLLIRRGNLLRFAYPGNAITALVEARELARQTDDPFLVAEAEVLLGVNYGYANQFRAGLASMERGIASIEAMPMSLQQSTNSIRSWLNLAANGNEERDSADDTAALEVFRANGVDFRRCLYCWHLASAGNLAAAAAVQDRLAGILDRDFSTRGGIRVMAAFARHGQAVLAIAAGEPDAGRRHWAIARPDFGDHHMLVAFTLLDELRDLALPYDAAHPPARRELATMAEAALGRAGGALRPGVSPKLAWLRCLVVDGRWDEVVQILDDLPDPGNCRLRRETTYARVELARHRGEPEQAWAEIRPLLPQGPATEPGDLMHQEGLYLLRLAAGLCLDAGDLPGAEAWLTAHDRWLAWSGSVLGRAEGRLAWGLYHHAVGDADRARAAAGDALALATDPDQPLVRLGAHRLLGTLDHAARRVEAAEAHLGIAMTIADACEVPFERALTLLALAELREATGAATEAVTHMAEARAIGTTLGAIAVLQHADTLAARLAGKPGSQANRFGLTSRELDVLRLLARHRTDKEIAETLFISPHTASTHVKHVLAKLGVASRRDAADIAVAHGIA